MEPEVQLALFNETDVPVAETQVNDLVDAEVLDPMSKLAVEVKSKFEQAKTGRYEDEQRWMQAYRNYRGVYGPDVQFTEAEKSRVFVKVTKTKVLAAYEQVVGVLLGSNKFPLSVEPTVVPEGISEAVHFDLQPKPVAQDVSQPEELADRSLKPGETYQEYRSRLGPLEKKLDPVADKIEEGEGATPTQVTFHPAMVAAKNMEKKIQDALLESNAVSHLRTIAFEASLFGSGVAKGPFSRQKEYAQWDENGNYNPTIKDMPHLSSVSLWNFYPDPDALSKEDLEFAIERHRLTPSQFRSLKKRKHFNKQAISDVMLGGENYIEEWWESAIREDETRGAPKRYEVLEFWGYMDSSFFENTDVDLGSYSDKEEVCVNVWVSGGRVLRAIVNPFKPQNIPYHVVPYEINPYSIFGVGVAENMDDTQTLMNGFMRMAVDNAALSGNLIFEVDSQALAPGQDMKVYPGKVFERESGAPGQAIFAHQFPNISNQNMQMFDKARVLADESTGFPSFAHGQTGVQGIGRTASGISMLMNAAHGSSRSVIKNFDDFLIVPIGKGFFYFFMQFDPDPDIKGDLEVKAQGTASLMQNEVRSQRLMQFLSLVQSPVLAPFAKMDYIIREIAQSMDLDADKVVNNMADAALQAEMMKQFQQTMTPPEQGQPGMEGAPALPAPNDTSGGGNQNIGIGQAPLPDEQGFTGNV